MDNKLQDDTNRIVKHFSTEREAADVCQISACALRSAVKGNEVCSEIRHRIAMCAAAIQNGLELSKVVDWKRNDQAVRRSAVKLGRSRRGMKPRDIRGVAMRFKKEGDYQNRGIDDGPLLPRVHNGYQISDNTDILVRVGSIGSKSVYAPAIATPLPNITPDKLVIL